MLRVLRVCFFFFFFFNDTATTEIYTLSLHDALPISFDTCLRAPGDRHGGLFRPHDLRPGRRSGRLAGPWRADGRSEEHTSELQSLAYLVCRLLLEKKKKIYNYLLHSIRRTVTIVTVY